MKRILLFALVLSFVLSTTLLAGCSRQPSVKRTTNIMTGYFHKYSKKYPDSVLGQNPVEKINILHVEEIHKNFVAVYAILELKNGLAVQTRYTLKKKPFGWKTDAWENMGIAMAGENPGNP